MITQHKEIRVGSIVMVVAPDGNSFDRGPFIVAHIVDAEDPCYKLYPYSETEDLPCDADIVELMVYELWKPWYAERAN